MIRLPERQQNFVLDLRPLFKDLLDNWVCDIQAWLRLMKELRVYDDFEALLRKFNWQIHNQLTSGVDLDDIVYELNYLGEWTDGLVPRDHCNLPEGFVRCSNTWLRIDERSERVWRLSIYRIPGPREFFVLWDVMDMLHKSAGRPNFEYVDARPKSVRSKVHDALSDMYFRMRDYGVNPVLPFM